jgi:hypothetical protein
MVKKGRGNGYFKMLPQRGSMNINAKLDEQKVRDIKKKVRVGMRTSALAKEYGISVPTISGIKAGRVWAHV